jgi:hypothetical protein
MKNGQTVDDRLLSGYVPLNFLRAGDGGERSGLVLWTLMGMLQDLCEAFRSGAPIKWAASDP